MNRLSHASWILLGICCFALLVRLPTVGYGLPLHLYGDEEANVYSALQMLDMHTLLPVLHPAEFNNVLYEPPLTAYVCAVAFVPTLALEYLVHGLPPLAVFKASLLIDPSPFFLVARLLEMCISLIGIFLVYRIGRLLFQSERPALLAAAFLATSFLDTTLAVTARHWTIGVCLGLAALWCALEAFARERHTRWLIAGGLCLGLSFGASYAVYLIPLLGLLILWQSGWFRALPAAFANLCAFFLPAAFVAGVMVAVDPYPLYAQAINHVIPAGQRVLGTFLAYYGHALWQYELPLAIFGTLGAFALIYWRRELALLFAVFFATALVLMFYFMPNLARYLLPLVPMLALLAGYGLDRLLVAVPHRVGIALMVAFAAYMCALYGRYELLMLRNDVRTNAVAWVEQHIPAGSTVLVESDTMRLYGTPASLAAMRRLEPDRLRSGDRALLAGAPLPAGASAYDLYYLSATSSQARVAMVKYAEATSTSPIYLLADRTAALQAGPLFMASTTIALFATGATYGLDAPFVGGYNLFIGGNMGLETPAQWHVPLLDLLYGTQYLGADVTLYRL